MGEKTADIICQIQLFSYLHNKMKKVTNYILLLISLVIFQIQGLGQSTDCATDFIHNNRMQTDSVYRNQIHRLESNVDTSIQNHSNSLLKSTIYSIPVVVHVIHLGEPFGTGSNISDIQIQQAIAALNTRFRNTNGLGADVELEFCLANNDPNGNSTNGINRVDGSSVPNYSINGIKPTGNSCNGAVETSIKDLSRWPVSDYYNIWVVSEICNGGFVGFASYPVGGLYDGLVIVSTSMTSNSGTLPHEIGHGFFLYHTFNGDGGNVNCPLDTDCSTDGDHICDTPPHKQSDCGLTNPCTSAGVWDNSRYNYMAYCPLVNRFTQGQKDRIRATAIASPRASLLTSEGCGALGSNEISNTNLFSIYPNPANTEITIVLPSCNTSQIEISNATGQLIIKDQNKNKIDISTLPNGLYFISVKQGEQNYTQKIIKQ
jgi:hypothetical protein